MSSQAEQLNELARVYMIAVRDVSPEGTSTTAALAALGLMLGLMLDELPARVREGFIAVLAV